MNLLPRVLSRSPLFAVAIALFNFMMAKVAEVSAFNLQGIYCYLNFALKDMMTNLFCQFANVLYRRFLNVFNVVVFTLQFICTCWDPTFRKLGASTIFF